MAFSLKDMLRWFAGGAKKQKSLFKTDREAYEFCRNAHKKQGGIPPELQRSYEFYVKNYHDDCQPGTRHISI